MVTLTSDSTSFSRRKSSLQVPATLLGTCFLPQKLRLGLTHLYTDLFVPSGAPNNESGERAEMSVLVKWEDRVERVCVCGRSRTGSVRVTRCPPLRGTNRLASGRWNFPEHSLWTVQRGRLVCQAGRLPALTPPTWSACTWCGAYHNGSETGQLPLRAAGHAVLTGNGEQGWGQKHSWSFPEPSSLPGFTTVTLVTLLSSMATGWFVCEGFSFSFLGRWEGSSNLEMLLAKGNASERGECHKTCDRIWSHLSAV